eukprot:scaffold65824_cov69-Phaeocystis_antarctica.AAC.8
MHAVLSGDQPGRYSDAMRARVGEVVLQELDVAARGGAELDHHGWHVTLARPRDFLLRAAQPLGAGKHVEHQGRWLDALGLHFWVVDRRRGRAGSLLVPCSMFGVGEEAAGTSRLNDFNDAPALERY